MGRKSNQDRMLMREIEEFGMANRPPATFWCDGYKYGRYTDGYFRHLITRESGRHGRKKRSRVSQKEFFKAWRKVSKQSKSRR